MADNAVDDYTDWNLWFRQRILALMLDPVFWLRFGSEIIKPEYFDVESEKRICTSLIKFAIDYDRPPDEDELLVLENWTTNEEDHILELYDIVGGSEDLDFTKDVVIQFAQEQAMKIAILDSIDDINNGNIKRPMQRMEKARNVGEDVLQHGTYFDDVGKWLIPEIHGEKIITGFLDLDKHLDGGITKGEVGIFVGTPGIGKTQTLVNIGCGAISPLSKKNVLHITLEISKNIVMKRYAARISGEWYKRGGSISNYKTMLEEKIRKNTSSRLLVAEFPSKSLSMDELKNFLKRIKRTIFDYDLILLDHLGELRIHRNADRYTTFGDMVRELRGLVHPDNLNVAMWTAFHASRSSVGSKYVGGSNIADSYQIVGVADIIVGCSQTHKEKVMGLMRFYEDKVRDGEDKRITYCRIDKDSHMMSSITKEEYDSVMKSDDTDYDADHDGTDIKKVLGKKAFQRSA